MAITGIIAAIAGAGIVEGVSALTSSSKTASQGPAQATLPSETTASSSAQTAQTQSRQSALAAGGGTNVTSGSGIILGSDVSAITLVGSS